MKKTFIYTSIILLLTIITAGATYAYLVSTTKSNNNAVATEGAEIKVIYTGGKTIEGLISLSENKSGGLNTTVNIALEEDSAPVKTSLFINVDQITNTLAVEGFKWEVYKNSETTPISYGDFTQCKNGNGFKKCANGDKLYIVNNYLTSTTNTSFTVYVWLDGYKVGNEVIGAMFKGTIAAESEKLTGKLE